MKPISLIQVCGLAWFAASIVLEIGTTIFFMFWLRRRGIRLIFGLTGIPGYLEMHYRNLCRQQARSSTTILILRLLLLVNVFVAAIVVVPLVIMT